MTNKLARLVHETSVVWNYFQVSPTSKFDHPPQEESCRVSRYICAAKRWKEATAVTKKKKPHSCRLKSQLECTHWITSPFLSFKTPDSPNLWSSWSHHMPSLKYFSDQCSPELYSIVYSHIEKLTSGAVCISFTTDKHLQALAPG